MIWIVEAALSGLSVLLQAYLCYRLLAQRKSKIVPAFVAFSLFTFVSELALSTLYAWVNVSPGTYGTVYWILRLFMQMPMSAMLVGEIFGRRMLPVMIGLAWGASLWFWRPFSVHGLQAFDFGITAVAFLAVLFTRRQSVTVRVIGTGFIVASLFPAITETRQLFETGSYHNAFQIVSSVSLLLAQLIWICGIGRADALEARERTMIDFFRHSGKLLLRRLELVKLSPANDNSAARAA